MKGVCKACGQIMDLGPMAVKEIERGVPGYCANVGIFSPVTIIR